MDSRLLDKKWYLYLTEFFSGMAVMAVELGASRLLAPYFSSSQIVWTIIIGTIMIAMALGNVYGGLSSDKNPDPARLYRRLIIAAVWIAAIPVVGKYIIIAITGLLIVSISTNLLIWAAFIACMVIFVFPLFLLGTVTPSLTKFATRSLSDNGRVVGSLGAANTIGSIIGTFLPTFVTIPTVGTAITFLIFSGILLVIGIAYFLSIHKGYRGIAVSIILFLLCSALGNSDSFAFWEKNLTFEGESVYNYLQVRDTPSSTILSTNVLFGVQSIKMKNDQLTGLYYDYALASPFMASLARKSDAKVLILGMGTGTFAGLCREFFPNSYIEGVEIDEKITSLAYEYFDLSPDIPVTTYDGRAYLNSIQEDYDVIMVDAYQDITIPFQMSSVEFFSLVRDHLKDDGVMVVNMNMRSNEEGNITDYLCDTIATCFDNVYTVDVKGSTNRELFASQNPEMLDLLSEGTASLKNQKLKAMMAEVSSSIVPYEAGNYIFTDDKAPVELLGMRVIDGIIGNEIGYFKEAYKRGGFQALLNLI